MLSITPSRRIRIFERDGFKCLYCGASPPDAVLEVDHVVPRSRGGSNHDENLATACYRCNAGKRDRIMVPLGWDEKIKDVPARVKVKIASRPFPSKRQYKVTRAKDRRPSRLCALCGRTVICEESVRCGWCGRYSHPDCYEGHKTYAFSPCRARWQEIKERGVSGTPEVMGELRRMNRI